MHSTSTHLLTAAFGPALKRSSSIPPTFLIPSLITQSKSFSSTPIPSARKDGNPRRGVSALHRKGPKRIERLNELLSRIPGAQVPPELQPRDYTSPQPEGIEYLSPATKRARLNSAIAAALPKPVLDPAQRSNVEVDPDHGLWDFFNAERTALSTPLELSNYGRAWEVKELRNKDWEDLWRLWWVCCKERNRLESFRIEKGRLEGASGAMYGDNEVENRLEAVSLRLIGGWWVN
jgi:large subunit ribosomal protein L47